MGLEIYNTWLLGATDIDAVFKKLLGLRHVIATKRSSKQNINLMNIVRLYAQDINFIDNDFQEQGRSYRCSGGRVHLDNRKPQPGVRAQDMGIAAT